MGDIFSLRTLFALLLRTGSDLRVVCFSTGTDFVGVCKDGSSSLALGTDDNLAVALNISSIFSETLSAISSSSIEDRLEEQLSTVSEGRLAGTDIEGADTRLWFSKDPLGVWNVSSLGLVSVLR